MRAHIGGCVASMTITRLHMNAKYRLKTSSENLLFSDTFIYMSLRKIFKKRVTKHYGEFAT